MTSTHRVNVDIAQSDTPAPLAKPRLRPSPISLYWTSLSNIDSDPTADLLVEADPNADSTTNGAAAGIGGAATAGADRAAGLVADAFQQHADGTQLRGFDLQLFVFRVGLTL